MTFSISGTSGLTFPDSTTMTTGAQAVKAWVNFNGTTSPGTIRAAFNVGSVTKNGTGSYTVNFTTAMPDANSCVVVSSASQDTPGTTAQPAAIAGLITTTSASVGTMNSGIPSMQDRYYIGVAVFR